MQVRVIKGGGFTGLTEELGPLDTSTLDGDLEVRIEAKVEEIGFFDLPRKTPGDDPGVEAIWVRIRVEDGDRTHEVKYDNHSDPEKVVPLAELRKLIEKSGAGYHQAPRGEEA